jgi:prepilin-type N-terminal cleavage/methylation domain-containing protein/prepilin-type processing-associated H-X9-DG protein
VNIERNTFESKDAIRQRCDRLQRAADGFTLIELLTVIAVIAILASLLLPGIARSRAQAKTIVCINNQKLLSLAWLLYIEDWDGGLPPNTWYINPWTPTGPSWVLGWLENNPNYEWPDNTNIWHLQNSLLVPYLPSAVALWRCPSDPSSSLFDGQRLPRVRSYAMNGFMAGTPGRIDLLNWKLFQRATDIPFPSELFVMIDEREDTIQDGFFLVDMYEPRPFMNCAPRSAHNGAGVLSFADGHVIRKKWLDLAAWPCVSPIGHGAGHCTDRIDRVDSAPRDMGWLREHATVHY